MQVTASIRWESLTAPPVEERRARLAAAHLYAITADQESARLATAAEACLRGGAQLLQLRHKALARGELLNLARRLHEVTAAAGVLLIVNDHLDIALLADADGVHLGEDDLSVAEARRLAGPNFLVGASASNADAARTAAAAGADYLGAGPAFATPIKEAGAAGSSDSSLRDRRGDAGQRAGPGRGRDHSCLHDPRTLRLR